tara:strand:+ start:3045 stop:3659 length:615 start_codon:yes stop_codon:yes gene_type:complete
MEQGSQEWLQARSGKVTASRVADVIAKTKSGYGSGRANYMAELIAETLTKTPAPNIRVNAAMQWGTDTEPQARAAYEFFTDNSVVEKGLIDHPIIPMTAASPDGLVGTDGLVEIKCPNTATHIATLIKQKAPTKYNAQMQWQMACIEKKWCDFVSFDPRLPDDLQIFIQRVERDDDFINNAEAEIKKFQEEMAEKINILKELQK